MDDLSGQMDESRGLVKAWAVLNTRETVAGGNGDGTDMKPGAGGGRRDETGMNGQETCRTR